MGACCGEAGVGAGRLVEIGVCEGLQRPPRARPPHLSRTSWKGLAPYMAWKSVQPTDQTSLLLPSSGVPVGTWKSSGARYVAVQCACGQRVRPGRARAPHRRGAARRRSWVLRRPSALPCAATRACMRMHAWVLHARPHGSAPRCKGAAVRTSASSCRASASSRVAATAADGRALPKLRVRRRGGSGGGRVGGGDGVGGRSLRRGHCGALPVGLPTASPRGG
jgi:hypothetical protein